MGAKSQKHLVTGFVLVVCVGVLATFGYVVQRVGYTQVRSQGIRASLALAAARGGHMSAVRWLVSRGTRVNVTDQEGQNILSWVVSTGNAQDVRFLIAHGADVNHADDVGRTPLVWAAYRGDPSVVSTLVQAGAHVNPQGDITPLGAAIENGNSETMHLLLKQGANPNGWHRGWTPLMVSAMFGRSELILPLHAAGARIDVRDRSGRTAVMLARDAKTASTLRGLARTD